MKKDNHYTYYVPKTIKLPPGRYLKIGELIRTGDLYLSGVLKPTCFNKNDKVKVSPLSSYYRPNYMTKKQMVDFVNVTHSYYKGGVFVKGRRQIARQFTRSKQDSELMKMFVEYDLNYPELKCLASMLMGEIDSGWNGWEPTLDDILKPNTIEEL